MTASVRQETNTATLGSGASITAPAFGLACLSGSAIEIWVFYGGTTAPTSVTDSASQTYVSKGSDYNSNQDSTLALYVLQNNVSTTPLSFAATFATSPGGFNGVWAKEITGVSASSLQTSDVLSQHNPGAGANAVATGSLTPTSQPALVSAVSADIFSGLTSGPAPGSGFTFGMKGFTPNGAVYWGASESRRITSTAGLAATFTASDGAGDDFISGAAIYTEASSGASGSGTSADSADTSSGAGTEKISGSGATIDSTDVSSGSGTAVTGIAGSGTTTDSADVSAGSGKETVAGTGTTADSSDVSAASGAEKIAGSGAGADAPDTSAGSAHLGMVGAGATADAADASSGAGGEKITGSGTTLDAGDPSTGSGTAGGIGGSGATTDAADVSSGVGTEAIAGAAVSSDSADVSGGSGLETIRGSGTTADSPDQSSGSGFDGTSEAIVIIGEFFEVSRSAPFSMRGRSSFSSKTRVAFSATRH